MPPVAILTGTALAGTAASSAGGKKASNKASDAATQQLNIQKQQLAQSQQLITEGQSAFNPAKDYWTSLLQGGQAAQVAVAPIAEQVQATSEAGQKNILNSLPAGGERNLALAQAKIQQGADVSRLYAGVQPTAAQNLAQLAGIAGGQGVGIANTASPSTANATNYFANTAATDSASAGQSASALGRYLYQAAQKNGSNSGTGGSPGVKG